ncbi:hypothetical protein FF38_05904 [Lucilia cuprina]|uniref:Uncharacterized protein n=1 Tax=Lucilia cuprina TaxID=7375 RepID=A0A0L0CPK1_LUCCU|nr:hypothetical protein FF38_05904 [Lucilia cuprina]
MTLLEKRKFNISQFPHCFVVRSVVNFDPAGLDVVREIVIIIRNYVEEISTKTKTRTKIPEKQKLPKKTTQAIYI